jgi:hypothetical protein
MFGLPANAALRVEAVIVSIADACAVKRAKAQYPNMPLERPTLGSALSAQ